MIFYNGTEYPEVKLSCNRENMTKLVEALESGEYPQAWGSLIGIAADGSRSYCCAGVACQISGLGSWDGTLFEVTEDGDSDDSVMPLAVARWLGIPESFGRYAKNLPLSDSPHDYDSPLVGTEVNDGCDSEASWDFKQIAAQLRKTYLTD